MLEFDQVTFVQIVSHAIVRLDVENFFCCPFDWNSGWNLFSCHSYLSRPFSTVIEQ